MVKEHRHIRKHSQITGRLSFIWVQQSFICRLKDDSGLSNMSHMNSVSMIHIIFILNPLSDSFKGICVCCSSIYFYLSTAYRSCSMFSLISNMKHWIRWNILADFSVEKKNQTKIHRKSSKSSKTTKLTHCINIDVNPSIPIGTKSK